MDINLYIDSNNILTNNSILDLNKLYCKINNDNENTMELYSNTSYNFKFNSNNLNSTLNLSEYL